MIPCSSPRSSGCLATDWIMEPNTTPMPIPAPSDPSPMPRPKPSAFAALTTSPEASKWMSTCPPFPSLVSRLDGRADVDGCQCGEDERLNGHDDDHFEQIEGDADRERDRND